MTVGGDRPRDDELELTLLGPGYGESVVLHIGGGSWILVDSCGRTDAPMALDYLRSLNLDPAQVVALVVATHWHDDHIRGMAHLVEVCANAKFCCSGALNREEFLGAVGALERRDVGAAGSGVRELHRTLSRLLETRATLTWALANRVIFANETCQVWALAPADDTFTRFLKDLGRMLPQVGSAETRIGSLSPNDVAVVLWVTMGDVAVLLGSDLERQGWSTIVHDSERPAGRASAFKVPHHGSESAHEQRVWENMLEREPVAVIAPWRRGGRVSPTRRDKRRILTMTPNAYVSGNVDSTGAVRRRPPMVQRAVRECGIRLHATPTPSAVRLRRRLGSDKSWSVEQLGSACHLRDFAV